jgi:hypothetical protein
MTAILFLQLLLLYFYQMTPILRQETLNVLTIISHLTFSEMSLETKNYPARSVSFLLCHKTLGNQENVKV